MRRVITLAPDLTNEKIAEMIRKARWGNQVKCPHCNSTNIEKAGHASKPYIQKYHCKNCGKYFNDLTRTPLSGTHLSLRTIALIAYLYLKLGLTGEAIRRALGISKKAVQKWIKIINRQAKFFRDMILLDEPAEVDETYKNAGRKGKKTVKKPRKRGRKGRGRGTYSTDRPPIFTVYGRTTGSIVYRAHRKATKNTSRIVVRRHVKTGNVVYTDSYDIYGWLDRSRSYGHEAVNHSVGEYARGDAHINGAEYANQRLKEFLLGKRGVSKFCLDEYCGAATFWVNRCVWSPREAFLDIIGSIFVQCRST